MYSATFRFYEELNDFLPAWKRKIPFDVEFKGYPSVKYLIELQGVPHTEVDLILVNGSTASFNEKIKHGDFVSVYPVFESFDISKDNRLRDRPLRNLNFIIDVHLGKLAHFLRMLGFDCKYENDSDDEEIIEISLKENRIILTRDLGLLKRKQVTRGYWVRSKKSDEQLVEVIKRFDLKGDVKPFTRCLRCNEILEKVDKKAIEKELPDIVRQRYDAFVRCNKCGKIYWKGHHFRNIEKITEKAGIGITSSFPTPHTSHPSALCKSIRV